jgi:hypothetical protein
MPAPGKHIITESGLMLKYFRLPARPKNRRLVDKVNATGHIVRGCNNSYKQTVAVRTTNGVT